MLCWPCSQRELKALKQTHAEMFDSHMTPNSGAASAAILPLGSDQSERGGDALHEKHHSGIESFDLSDQVSRDFGLLISFMIS